MRETQGRARLRRLKVSDWPVRKKVALVLAVPLLLAVVLGGLRVFSAVDRSVEASATASEVTLLRPAVGYLSAAEDAALVQRSADSSEGDRRAAVAAVEEAATELGRVATNADLSDAQRELVDRLLTESRSLRDGRAYVTTPTAVAQLEKLKAEVSLALAAMLDSPAGGSLGLVRQLNEGRLAVVTQQLALLRGAENPPTDELYTQLGVESAAIGTILVSLPEDERVEDLRRGNTDTQAAVAAARPDIDVAAALPLYDELTTELMGQVESRLAADAASARTDALATLVLTLLALLVAVVLALLVSRALVVPVRRVRDGVLAVSRDLPQTVARIRAGRLPGKVEPIKVTTKEEMGQLARAVDDLHRTAIGLAQGEAELRSRVSDMFVTLSRRNTSLVNQQLHLIERLERDEEDPTRLESLFRLDHLASRMRRTAESLVVLSGTTTQRSEQDSLTVTEALHAATAGVQDYQRVTVATAPRLRINGSAAADVVHLLTELVDNALAFSPPTAPVTVVTSAPTGMLLVEVRDAGLGLEPQTLAMINQELREDGQITSETTRRMGLLVVSRLARRHGITVLLEDNVDGGITAQVFLPRAVLSGPAVDPEFVPVSDGVESGTDSGSTVSPELDAPAESDRLEPAATHVGDQAPSDPDPEPAAQPVAQPMTERLPSRFVPRDATPTPLPDGTDTLSAVISANIGLPQRQPQAGTPPLFPVARREPVEEPGQPETVTEAVQDQEPRAYVETSDDPWFGELRDQDGAGPADSAGSADSEDSETTPEDDAVPERPDDVEDDRDAGSSEADESADDDVDEDVPDSEVDDDTATVDDEATDHEVTEMVEHVEDVEDEATADAEVGEASESDDNQSLAESTDTDTVDVDTELAEDALVVDENEAPEAVASSGDEDSEETDELHATESADTDAGTDPDPADGADHAAAASEVQDTESDSAEVDRVVPLHPFLVESAAAWPRDLVHQAEDEDELVGLRNEEPLPTPALLPRRPAATLDEAPAELPPAPVLDADEDTPLFRMLRSSWFDGAQGEDAEEPTEVEALEQTAEQEAQPVAHADGSGLLPVRRPGDHLVPGGMPGAPTPIRRDPEALRARLSAHVAGVARGRAAAPAHQPDDHEE
jgi:signal transduction histidine kinase